MRLYGKNPVIERLKADPRSIRKIYVEAGHPDGAYVRRKAQKWSLPVFTVPRSKILKIARHGNTQGLVADVDDFEYDDFDALCEEALAKKHILFFLDQVQDPQNFGAIVRSLACLGRFRLVIPARRAVGVTEAVLRVACGGENFVRIAQVTNLARAIAQVREKGFWIAGAVVKGGRDIYRQTFSFPLGLVVGSEEKGLRSSVEAQCDARVTIPMAQPRLSLNVAQAATLLAFEAIRQGKEWRDDA